MKREVLLRHKQQRYDEPLEKKETSRNGRNSQISMPWDWRICPTLSSTCHEIWNRRNQNQIPTNSCRNTSIIPTNKNYNFTLRNQNLKLRLLEGKTWWSNPYQRGRQEKEKKRGRSIIMHMGHQVWGDQILFFWDPIKMFETKKHILCLLSKMQKETMNLNRCSSKMSAKLNIMSTSFDS